MTTSFGLGVAIHTPLSGVGEPDVSFFGAATIVGAPFSIRGGYANKSWTIDARLEGTLDLRFLLESLYEAPSGSLYFPRGFPAWSLSELAFTFDTESGDYTARGQTAAADFSFAGNTVENARLALALGSAKGSLWVKLESRVKWAGIDAELDVQFKRRASAFRLVANQYEFFLGRDTSESTTNTLVLVCPGNGVGFDHLELAWAKHAWTEVPFRDESTYSAGASIRATLALANTQCGRLLQIDESIRFQLDSANLNAEVGPAENPKKITIPLRQTNAATGTSAADSTSLTSFGETTSDDDESEASQAQLTITGPLSLASIIDALSPSSTGSSTASTWRDYVGKCLELENLGLSVITSPKIGISVVFDANIQVGSWLGIAVRQANVRLIPDKLPFTDVHVDASLQSAAIVLDLSPISKASIALRYDRDENTNIEALTGSGRLQIFDKINIGLLVHLEWQQRVFRGAFGFVFAKGFAAGTPAFQLTGIGGGFGYHRTLILPTTAESVATNPIIELLKTDPDGDAFSDPSRMLTNLKTFMKSLVDSPHGHSIALGITFRIVEWIDCVALVLADVHAPHVDLALLGMADFAIGVSSFELGRVQLALLTRWNSQDHSFRILGALGNKSWLLHPNCKIRGGFAISLWFGGDYAGDFVISLGGYSPLVPPQRHYPKLDRLGFTWNATEGMQLAGDLYFALDRYGLQFGGRAALKYTSTLLDVDASFSFDVLSRWMPLFFQTKVRVSVHFELRVIVTLRLGLVVDANVYGPPFGAEFLLEINLQAWQHTFTIRAGASLESAQKAGRPKLRDVLAFAKGGQTSATQMQVLGSALQTQRSDERSDVVHFANNPEPAQRFRGDDLTLNVSTTIPIKTVYRQRESVETRHPYVGDRLDIRPLEWQDVASDLIWDIRGPTNTADWVCIPEMTRPLESLWYLPPNEKTSWKESGRKAITSIRFAAPIGTYGDVGLGALSGDRLSDSDIERVHAVQSVPGQTTAPVAAANDFQPPQPSPTTRETLLEHLQALGFDLEGCQVSSPFRTLDAVPLHIPQRATS